jgi:hypothetical protein
MVVVDDYEEGIDSNGAENGKRQLHFKQQQQQQQQHALSAFGSSENLSDRELTASPAKRGASFIELKSQTIDSSNNSKNESQPNFSAKQSIRSRSDFERNNNIKTYYYQTAFSKGTKKLSDKVSEVYKRRVVMTLEHAFPYVKTRLPVIHEYEQILTPIEAAIENIAEQNKKLEESLYYSPPDIPQLQMVLQGSVAVGVNSGPVAIVISFLHEQERHKYNTKHIRKLNEKCYTFLQLCEIGIRVHSEYAGPEHRLLDNTFRQKFQELKHSIQAHLTPLSREQLSKLKQLNELKEFLRKNLAYAASTLFESVDEVSSARSAPLGIGHSDTAVHYGHSGNTSSNHNKISSSSFHGRRSNGRNSFRFSIPVQDAMTRKLNEY